MKKALKAIIDLYIKMISILIVDLLIPFVFFVGNPKTFFFNDLYLFLIDIIYIIVLYIYIWECESIARPARIWSGGTHRTKIIEKKINESNYTVKKYIFYLHQFINGIRLD